MSRGRRWFLPESPDVLAMLAEQMAVTRRGVAALAAWAHGDETQERTLREAEHQADEHKHTLQRTLRTAFTTPLEPEDLFTLSEGLDDVLNGAKDLVREADVMAMAPDPPLAEMADLLVEGVAHLESAFVRLGRRGEDATPDADLAVKCQRRIERVYRRAMSALLASDDLRMVMGRRELYRRMSRLGDSLVHVAERVWYATVKEA